MPQLPPSSDFRLRPALRDFAETSRRDKAGFGFNSKGSARASRAIRRAPASNIAAPTSATRASRTTREGACAPHFTRELEKLHPDNRHVRDKIRQQLQVLRDAGLLLHVERGEWRLP
ncbi:MAG: hypothetical protein ABSH15_16930 [Verrucomicrobiota bacterium]|jgi:hypothetical protein